MWSDPATKNIAVGKDSQNHGKPLRGCEARRGRTAAPTSTTISTASIHTQIMAATLAPATLMTAAL